MKLRLNDKDFLLKRFKSKRFKKIQFHHLNWWFQRIKENQSNQILIWISILEILKIISNLEWKKRTLFLMRILRVNLKIQKFLISIKKIKKENRNFSKDLKMFNDKILMLVRCLSKIIFKKDNNFNLLMKNTVLNKFLRKSIYNSVYWQ